jgi:bifunctional DNA-binding transcriptional regulator/antitoxin component of YhaV-PrlF toxin-antitoxin module
MPIIEVGSSGRLVIPSSVMRELGFVAGDSVALTKNEKGEVVMKKGKLEFTPSK